MDLGLGTPLTPPIMHDISGRIWKPWKYPLLAIQLVGGYDEPELSPLVVTSENGKIWGWNEKITFPGGPSAEYFWLIWHNAWGIEYPSLCKSQGGTHPVKVFCRNNVPIMGSTSILYVSDPINTLCQRHCWIDVDSIHQTAWARNLT